MTDISKLRRFIFTRDSISLCSFLRLFKSQRTEEHSKTKNHRFEWLYIYFIKCHTDSRSSDKITDHWICIFSNDEKYYRCIIDNQFLSVNLMIDSLLWSFERLSSFDFENDLLSEFIEFMINLSTDHLEYLCRFEFLIVFSKSSINVLKKINYSSFWNRFHSILMLWILNIYHNIRLLILFNDDWLNISLIETSSVQFFSINYILISQLILSLILNEKDEDRHSSHHVRLLFF